MGGDWADGDGGEALGWGGVVEAAEVVEQVGGSLVQVGGGGEVEGECSVRWVGAEGEKGFVWGDLGDVQADRQSGGVVGGELARTA